MLELRAAALSREVVWLLSRGLVLKHLLCPSSQLKGFRYRTLYFKQAAKCVSKASISMVRVNVDCAPVLVIHCHRE